MAFQRPYPRQRKTCEEYKAELEEENYHLRSELQTEVNSNCQNEKQIRKLEQNASKEEIAELKSEISSLKKQLYQTKEDIRNNEKHISNIERNSSDLYNSDDNMATIAELVDAIDGFVDNRATVRDILISQIKGATRQIHIKNNNLQWDLREVRRARTQLQTDLGRKQRRRYDAEAEHDNEII
ncbi:hypothetical protein RhiirA4_478196 [Rhizophagus irregularis]|uniref:Uncharacterized protein n=1 Tax=Rhizophagus irregularis TaxID=588596 RepID=A0A2I1HEI4_9GLOM|nr:hypothetical protein RhiirA4_478196 [Rhizophagus irregularis]